jgi:hypothetical protein
MAVTALMRSSSPMLFGVGLNDSRVVAPLLLCSGQRCLLCFVSKWFLPEDDGAVRCPSSIWRRKMEDLIAFFVFSFRVLSAYFLYPYVILCIS